MRAISESEWTKLKSEQKTFANQLISSDSNPSSLEQPNTRYGDIRMHRTSKHVMERMADTKSHCKNEDKVSFS